MYIHLSLISLFDIFSFFFPHSNIFLVSYFLSPSHFTLFLLPPNRTYPNFCTTSLQLSTLCIPSFRLHVSTKYMCQLFPIFYCFLLSVWVVSIIFVVFPLTNYTCIRVSSFIFFVLNFIYFMCIFFSIIFIPSSQLHFSIYPYFGVSVSSCFGPSVGKPLYIEEKKFGKNLNRIILIGKYI